MDTRISTVIPAFNAAEHLQRAIDSVLAQTHPVDEVIVVDDGSTDRTTAVVQSYDNRVQYIRQQNAGAGVARKTGVRAANGRWIAFLDADDEWLPEKTELQIDVLERNPDLAWVTGNYRKCTCQTNLRQDHLPIKRGRALLKGKDYFNDFFDAVRRNAWGCTDTMLIRREALLEVEDFTDMRGGNDLDLWWRIAYRHLRIGYVPEPLAVYHLDVEGSIVRTQHRGTMYADLLERHLELSKKFNRQNQFEQTARFLLQRWIRALLFEGNGEEVRLLLDRLGPLLPTSRRAAMRLLAAQPRLTSASLQLASRVIRGLGLRKTPVRSRRK